MEDSDSGEARPDPVFATTHWSVVLMAARSDTTRAQAALEHLCRTYWYPLYAYARRRGQAPPDAQCKSFGVTSRHSTFAIHFVRFANASY